MRKDLQKQLATLKKAQFRVETITPHNGKPYYIPQIKYKRKEWIEGFTDEWNKKEWFGFRATRFGKSSDINDYIGIYPTDHYNQMFLEETDAVNFIELYKKWKEQHIIDTPAREAKLKWAEEYQKQRRKEMFEEAERTAPKITHKYL